MVMLFLLNAQIPSTGMSVGSHDQADVVAGSDWSAFNALSSWSRKDRACLYGSNDVAAGCPNLLKMAAGHLAQAIYIVQVQEALLYCGES